MTGWLPDFMIGLAPLILLVALLMGGKYPGERTLARAQLLLARAFRHVRACGQATLRNLFGPVPARGGRLIANSMARRGPPSCV